MIKKRHQPMKRNVNILLVLVKINQTENIDDVYEYKQPKLLPTQVLQFSSNLSVTFHLNHSLDLKLKYTTKLFINKY